MNLEVDLTGSDLPTPPPVPAVLTDVAQLTGTQKAAILLLRLGPEQAAPLLRSLSRKEIAAVVAEVARLGAVDGRVAKQVVDEFLGLATGVGDRPLPVGDVKTARELLEESLGDRVAYEVLRDVNKSAPEVPFQFLHGIEPEIIAEYLQQEHAQTIALVLTNLTVDLAAGILTALPPQQLSEVGVRIGTLDRVTATTLEAVERGLQRRMAPLLDNVLAPGTGGVEALVELLNKVDKDAEQAIYGALEEYDPKLAETVRNKLFIFDDLVLLDDRQMQLVLRQVDASKLPVALKGVKEEVKNRILDNLSTRARENLLEEIELLGQIRRSDALQSQNEILDVIRSLEEAGEIVINRGGDDYVV
jgi:flagellar motor switch protein FliG